MAKRYEVYKCEVCENIVEVLQGGVGELICCKKPMILLEEHTEDSGYEKHVPVVEKDGDEIKVKVGSVPHPMEDTHFIEFIEILSDGIVVGSARLNPSDKPEAEFCLEKTNGITARALCNIHGVWIS